MFGYSVLSKEWYWLYHSLHKTEYPSMNKKPKNQNHICLIQCCSNKISRRISRCYLEDESDPQKQIITKFMLRYSFHSCISLFALYISTPFHTLLSLFPLKGRIGFSLLSKWCQSFITCIFNTDFIDKKARAFQCAILKNSLIFKSRFLQHLRYFILSTCASLSFLPISPLPSTASFSPNPHFSLPLKRWHRRF